MLKEEHKVLWEEIVKEAQWNSAIDRMFDENTFYGQQGVKKIERAIAILAVDQELKRLGGI